METFRIHEDTSVYFVTFSVVDWLPVFVNEAACLIVTSSLSYCHDHMGLRVDSYVIMPTHIHAIVYNHEHDSARLAATLTAFRKYTGRSLLDYAAKSLPPSFTQAFRDDAQTDRQRRFWQPSRHPVGLRGQKWRQQKRHYLHDNPRRKGLVLYAEHWRFSSARFYLEGTDEYADVPITPVE